MYHEMTFAGFGGQGVLYAARLLAHAAMIQDLHVAWVPVYGPEMRGGAASASVVISDEDIDSLVVTHPDTGVFMSQPSLDRYGDRVKAGGVILFNCSLIAYGPERTDVTVVPIPANETAHALGDDRAANMVMLGAAIRVTGVVPLAAVLTGFDQTAKDKESVLYRVDRAALAQSADDRAGPD